ncbi:MAG: AMP-binding protein [Erysipelotrichaceae bacterium]|nr:AMP-binding protein [Erysipelotrichaceae bacterium]
MPTRNKIEVSEEIKRVTKIVTDKIAETGTKNTEVKIPWSGHTGDVPLFLDYFEGTMFDKIEDVASKYPNNIAFDFMGKHTTYRRFVENVHIVAKSLKTIGVRKGDCVTIAMPNCPQAIYAFYAVNLVGGIANMIHPLSAEKEIEFYLNESNSVTAITLDQFYHKFESIRKNTKVVNIIIASIKDELSKPIKAGYMLTDGYKIKRIPKDAPVIRWKQFIKLSRCCFYNYKVDRRSNDPAVILYSGGTTGTTKGIVLTNKNFNALAAQIKATNPMYTTGDKMLAAMPLFHGFGLGVCVHSMLANGGRCVLIPRFTPKSYAKDLVKYKCNFVAGVPTLFEALLRLPSMEKADLSSLKGVFSGGDSLSIELKKKLDQFLADHKATIQVREGYGTTETVTACCLTPVNFAKEGSIGVPFPDTYIKIVKPGTDKELPYGKEGEILLAGPTVMKEYWKHPDETANTLRKHKDGLTWVYTGDLGIMDNDGFIYFKGRAKRMIITSGYNVYPSQIENILEAHPAVQLSCVIGVPDSYKMEKVKAFVTLKPGIEPNQDIKDSIMNHCRKNIAKYAMPYDIEFRNDMPKTLVGKVAYRKLEEEEQKKFKQQAQ